MVSVVECLFPLPLAIHGGKVVWFFYVFKKQML